MSSSARRQSCSDRRRLSHASRSLAFFIDSLAKQRSTKSSVTGMSGGLEFLERVGFNTPKIENMPEAYAALTRRNRFQKAVPAPDISTFKYRCCWNSPLTGMRGSADR